MSTRRRPSARGRAARRLTRPLGHESLEARHLLAVSPLHLVEDDGTSARSGGSLPSGGHRPVVANLVATDHYIADGVAIGMVESPTRIALAATAAGRADRSWQTEVGLTFLRGLAGSRFDVYATTGPLDGATLQALYARGVVDGEVPVFDVLDSGSEAVLLDEAIVELADGVDAAAYFGARPVFAAHRPLAGTPNQFVVTLAAGPGRAALEVINGLDGDRQLAWAAPNFHQNWQRYYLPDDPRIPNQWHVQNTGQSGGLPGAVGADADLVAAWDVVQGGSTALTIAVVDDGVPTNHPDINPWVNPGEVAGNGLDDDGNGWVDDVNGWNFVSNNNISVPNTANDGHGTAVAGVAAARGDNGVGVVGASYGTPVLSSRIFENNVAATDARIAEAIYYAAGRTANGLGSWKAGDVSNHSWGGGANSAAINGALTWATSQGRQGLGSTQFFAAGNGGLAVVGYPASQATTNAGISVVGSMNNLGQRSEYSQVGAVLDILTPSNDFRTGYLAIDTTDRVSSAGYNTAAGAAGDYTGNGATGFGGTSSSAPVATGTGALALARAQVLGVTLSAAQLRSLMRANTTLISTADTGFSYDPATGQSLTHGFGLLSAGSLVRAIGTREISVTSAGFEITNGSTGSFGSVLVDDSVVATLRIRNQGTLPLTISGLTATGDFTVATGPGQSTLGLGEGTTFTIRFTPSAAGSRSGTVTILSNDADEGSFVFTVEGTGTPTNVSGYLFEDADGDAVRQGDEAGIGSRTVFLDTNGNGTFDNAIEDVTVNAAIDVGLIPDGTATGAGAPLVSTLAVSGLTQKITDVDVTVNINHTWISDLDVVLIAPSGRRIMLAESVGGSGDNFTGTIFDDQAGTAITAGTPPFTGRFRPAQPLSALLGEDPNGTWSLEITDFFQADQGTLTGWSIRVRTGEESAVTNANGFYSFSGLAAGTYSLASVLPAGWSASGVASRSFTVTGPASTDRGNDLGSGVNNRFYGRVFDDANANGVKDPGEPGLSGRTLFIDANGNGIVDPPTQTTFTSSTALAIPDKPASGFSPVTSSIVVSGIGAFTTDVNVRLTITHTWDSDLDVFLIAPDGTRVELFTDVGGSGDNFTNTVLDDQAATAITAGTAPFTGTFRPEGSLATLNGKNPNGTWTLEITDDAVGDVGTLNSWAVIITTAADPVQATDAAGRALFDLAAGAVSVTHSLAAGWVATAPSSNVRAVTAAGAPLFAQTYGVKQRPTITSNATSVTVPEGTAAAVTGTWGTAYPADVIVLSASTGSVTRNPDGTWSWTATPADQFAATTVTITATDPQGIASATSFSFTATNASPAVAATSVAVTGNVLQTLGNTGTWSDVAADTVTLSASLGTVTKNSDGTWSWSLTPSSKLTDQTVTITASDEDGGTSTTTFTVTAKVAVPNQQIYYKGSSFAGTSVDAALDPGKVLARPGGTAQTLSYANLVNGSRGLNGIVIDVAGLVDTSLSAADFSFKMSPQGAFDEAANPPSAWAAAPVPTAIVVTPGTATIPARVRLEWPDNAIANRWLQVAVLANARTGLDAAAVSYVGHLQGEVNGQVSVGRFRVTAGDVTPVGAQIGATVTVGSAFDLVKNGRITTADLTAVSSQIGLRELRVITIPVAGSGGHGTFEPGPSGPSLQSGTSGSGGSIDFAALAAWAGAQQVSQPDAPAGTPTGNAKPKR